MAKRQERQKRTLGNVEKSSLARHLKSNRLTPHHHSCPSTLPLVPRASRFIPSAPPVSWQRFPSSAKETRRRSEATKSIIALGHAALSCARAVIDVEVLLAPLRLWRNTDRVVVGSVLTIAGTRTGNSFSGYVIINFDLID